MNYTVIHCPRPRRSRSKRTRFVGQYIITVTALSITGILGFSSVPFGVVVGSACVSILMIFILVTRWTDYYFWRRPGSESSGNTNTDQH